VLERFAFDSGLHPDAKTRVAVHLQGCETCRTSVRTIRDLDFELAARVGEDVALERIRRPRPGRWRRLVARLLGR
jgi:anti-sigma factor RsiW